jgi:hypothetical protein
MHRRSKAQVPGLGHRAVSTRPRGSSARARPLAEEVGFEPTVALRPQRFSRPSDSSTLALLQLDFRVPDPQYPRCLSCSGHSRSGPHEAPIVQARCGRAYGGRVGIALTIVDSGSGGPHSLSLTRGSRGFPGDTGPGDSTDAGGWCSPKVSRVPIVRLSRPSRESLVRGTGRGRRPERCTWPLPTVGRQSFAGTTYGPVCSIATPTPGGGTE